MFTLKKYKQLIISILVVLLIPIVFPIIITFFEILLSLGKYIGMNFGLYNERINFK